MRHFLRFATVAVFLSLSAGAIAQPKEDRPQAEQALKDGIKAYKDGKYEEALAAYLRAAELAPSASGPYREMGKTYEALGRGEDAKTAYQEYLSRKPDADDAEEIKGRLKVLGVKTPAKQNANTALDPINPENNSSQVDAGEDKKRPAWVWVAGGAALVGLGVGTAVAIDAIEGGGDSGKGRGRGRGGDQNKRGQATPILFTFGF